jgi:hypothetical protein
MGRFFGIASARVNWDDRGAKVAEENPKPGLFLIERRRKERRIVVNVAVEVTVDRGNGDKFTERAIIEDVSDMGCRFTTHGTAQTGDTVSLRILGPAGQPLADEEPRLYQIMWVARNDRSCTVGARLVKGKTLNAVESRTETGDLNPRLK